MAWGDAVIVAPESIEGIKKQPGGKQVRSRSQNGVRGDSISLVPQRQTIGEHLLFWKAQRLSTFQNQPRHSRP